MKQVSLGDMCHHTEITLIINNISVKVNRGSIGKIEDFVWHALNKFQEFADWTLEKIREGLTKLSFCPDSKTLVLTVNNPT